jgi:hypothetical protein
MNVNFYKIVCNNTGAIYVGSTVKTIEQRLQNHENHYRLYLDGKFCFITSFIILENKNYSIELIDSVVCTDKKHRDLIEGLHILNNDCINKYQPGRDKKQYRQDNKEQIKEYKKQYYQDNKEQRKEYQKQYGQDNKEQIKEYQKQYGEDNKEKLKEYKKQWYQDNKEKKSEKFNCPCGGRYIFSSKARHLKTKLHIAYLATL